MAVGGRNLRLVSMALATASGLGLGLVLTRPWKAVLGQLSGDDGECELAPLGQLAAPGGKERAVWYARSCPASSGTTLDVSVVPAHAEVLGQAGNALVLDANNRRPALAVSWGAHGELQLALDPAARVERRAQRASGHAVVLLPLAPPDAGR